jgi:hypothetical protein
VGHVLFVPALHGVMRLADTGRPWLATTPVGESATAVLATLVAAGAGILFVAAGVGIVAQAGWWRPVAVLAAILSVLVILGTWNAAPTSSALFALAFDAVVLVALLIAHWPAPETLGS